MSAIPEAPRVQMGPPTPPQVHVPAAADRSAAHPSAAHPSARPTTGQAPRPARPHIPTTREDASVGLLMVEDLPQVTEHVRQLLGDHDHVSLLETLPDGRNAMEQIGERRPDVLIIDVLLQGPENGLQLARRIRQSGIATPIVLVTIRERPVTLTPDLGIADVLTLPFTSDHLLEAIVRVDDAHRGPPPSRPSGTFVVHSAKGGQGATTVAHDLAVALGRLPGTRVALVDGDLQYGDLRLQFDLPDTVPSILQLPTGHLTVADLEPVMWSHPAGIDVLLAPPRLEQADLISLRDVQKALRVLREAFDVVIVDAPTPMHDTTLALLDLADATVSVVTPEAGAVRKSARCRQVLQAARYPMDKIVTVLNRSDAPGLGAQAVSAALGTHLAALLPLEPRLVAAGEDAASALVVMHPDAPFSRGIDGLARLLAQRTDTGARVRAAAA